MPTTARTRARTRTRTRTPGLARAAHHACLSPRRPTQRTKSRPSLSAASWAIRATRQPGGRPEAAGAPRMRARCTSCSTSSRRFNLGMLRRRPISFMFI